jgi:hypothetical protein
MLPPSKQLLLNEIEKEHVIGPLRAPFLNRISPLFLNC